MIDILYFILVAFISYFLGTINFSKMLSWYVKHKDITKMGSGNPGTMNMLRSYGFGIAFATFLAEIVRSGLTCLVFKLIFPQYDQVIYFVSAIFLLLGNNFPIWSKFKGGKGVATFAGVFLFSNLWYVALAWFVVCFILFMFIEYASVISFTYIGGLSIAYTIYAFVCHIYYAWLVVVIIWVMYVIMLARHHANIKRLFTHTENKIDFKAKLAKVFKHKRGETIIDEEFVEHAPETEIIVTQLEKKEEKQEEQVDEIVESRDAESIDLVEDESANDDIIIDDDQGTILQENSVENTELEKMIKPKQEEINSQPISSNESGISNSFDSDILRDNDYQINSQDEINKDVADDGTHIDQSHNTNVDSDSK